MLKALMIRKKISDKNKELEALRTKCNELEAKKSEFETRESELASDIEAASTDEERSAVEEAVEAFENEKKECDVQTEEVVNQINDLEGEVKELERELEETEASQTPEANPIEPTKKEITEERNSIKMFKTRSLNTMTFEARSAIVAREDVKATLASVRSLIKEKRTVTGSEVFIGTSIFELVKENILEYSKLYQEVKLQFTNKDGRVPVEGTIPEAIWVECCAAIPELAIAFTDEELDCHKVAGFFAICDASVEDADIDLLDTLTDALSAALGLAVDKAILYGTGVKMPLGVVTAINADDSLKTTNLITIESSKTGKELFKDIIKASGKAKGNYSKGSKIWICSETTRTTLIAEAIEFNASGALVSGVNQSMPVDGGKLIVLNFVPDDNIICGYFDLYSLLVKRGFTLKSSTEVRFLDDQTVIKGTARMDGKPIIKNAFVAIGYGSAPTTSITFAAIASTQPENGEG